jgi:hypothetical protein
MSITGYGKNQWPGAGGADIPVHMEQAIPRISRCDYLSPAAHPALTPSIFHTGIGATGE